MGKRNNIKEVAARLAEECVNMLVNQMGVQNTIGEGDNDRLKVGVTINGIGCDLALNWNVTDEDDNEPDEDVE